MYQKTWQSKQLKLNTSVQIVNKLQDCYTNNNNGSHISFLKIKLFPCHSQQFSIYTPPQVFKPLFLSNSET